MAIAIDNDSQEIAPVDDRRAALTAAFEKADESSSAEIAPKQETLFAEEPKAEEPKAEEPKAEEGAPESTRPEKVYAVDKPPQSWRPAQRAKWAAMDADVRQEVIRRERDIERTLGETAHARQISQAFTQVVQPYMARIQSLGMHPVAAVQELLKADHVLTTSRGHSQAAFMANLIKSYNVDIQELDRALAGVEPADPVSSRVDKLLQERLQPFEKFIQDQTQGNQARQQVEMSTMEQNIAAMASDPKFPEFDAVREDMADIIEIQSKKGVYLSLEQAYTRAIAMNPEVSQRVRQQTDQAQNSASARAAHARAQKALNASKSVGGAPGAVPSGATVGNDRRSTIAAAFDQAEGR